MHHADQPRVDHEQPILDALMDNLNHVYQQFKGHPSIIVSLEFRPSYDLPDPYWEGWYAKCNDKMGDMFMGKDAAACALNLADRMAYVRIEKIKDDLFKHTVYPHNSTPQG